jgi:hypothetical protein
MFGEAVQSFKKSMGEPATPPVDVAERISGKLLCIFINTLQFLSNIDCNDLLRVKNPEWDSHRVMAIPGSSPGPD